jgi:GNAT superfamily N-acetyltransferase
MTEEQIRDEVLVAPRRAFIQTPDLRVIERPGWMQIITPSFTSGGNNEVAHAEISDEAADAVIEAVIAEYRAVGVKWRWTVGPGSKPADLAERLVRRGLALHQVAALARETDGLAPVPGVVVERVDAGSLPEFTSIVARGWSADPAQLAPAHEIAVRSPVSRHRLYLARIDGVPVGTGAAVWFDRSIYLQGGVVLPSHQRRGAYRALVAARLADAAAAGITLATSHARPETSAPILEGLGFRVIERFGSYSFP